MHFDEVEADAARAPRGFGIRREQGLQPRAVERVPPEGSVPPGTTVRVEVKTQHSSMRQEATVNTDGTWKVDFADMGNLGTLEPGLYTATATVVPG